MQLLAPQCFGPSRSLAEAIPLILERLLVVIGQTECDQLSVRAR